jgi:hypothetical protein
LQTSVADLRCLSRIPDLTLFHPSRIQLFHPGSRIQLFHLGSRIQIFLSRIHIKEFKYFNSKKLFLSSRKYDPGCSSPIRILTFYPSRIPEPGVKKAPDPGSATLQVCSTALCMQDDDQEATQEARQRLEAVHRLVSIPNTSHQCTKDGFAKFKRHKISSIPPYSISYQCTKDRFAKVNRHTSCLFPILLIHLLSNHST